MSDSEADRRVHPRFDLMAQVRVKRGKVDYIMELTNISFTGALVDMGTLRVPSWVETGRVVEIGIIHPVDLDTILVKGEIVRVQKQASSTSFAVHFVAADVGVALGVARLLETAQAPSERPTDKASPPPLPG